MPKNYDINISNDLQKLIGDVFKFDNKINNDIEEDESNIKEDESLCNICLTKLIKLKLKAVEDEDYESAKKYKLKIDRIKLVINQIIELERDKLRYVEDEDYDKAKKVKIQIDKLRNEALIDNRLNENEDIHLNDDIYDNKSNININ